VIDEVLTLPTHTHRDRDRDDRVDMIKEKKIVQYNGVVSQRGHTGVPVVFPSYIL